MLGSSVLWLDIGVSVVYDGVVQWLLRLVFRAKIRKGRNAVELTEDLVARARMGDARARRLIFGDPERTRELLSRALAGDAVAAHALCLGLLPVVEVRVSRVLSRRGSTLRHSKADICQQVFVELFEDGGRALRAWASDGGRSLVNFVARKADWVAASALRTRATNPVVEDPTPDDVLEQFVNGLGTQVDIVARRDFIASLCDRIEQSFSPKRWALLRFIYVDQISDDEICALTGMKRGALHTERSRMLKRITELSRELQTEQTTGPKTATGGRP